MDKLNIIYFGNDWFGENKTSSHHISSLLSKDHNVYYLECPGMRMPKGNTRDFTKIFKKIKKCLTSPFRVNEAFSVYTLFQIPLHKYSIIRSFNKKISLLFIRSIIKKNNIENYILWFHVPHMYYIPSFFKNNKSIYYCIDDYSTLPDVNKEIVRYMDDQMSINADAIFTSSMPLFDQKKRYQKDNYYSPHGVDFDHFNILESRSSHVPDDIENISSPLIGFWGLIEGRIDLDLIFYMAKERPNYNFVLIGYVDSNVQNNFKNVFFLGKKEYIDLPKYASSFDVAILPYKKNDFFYHCNPIKLREFMSTGLPIVSFRNPEIEKYEKYIHISDTYEDFLSSVDHCINEDTMEKALDRIDAVRGESWAARVATIVTKLKKFD
jgi:Glycosyl transferases group 1